MTPTANSCAPGNILNPEKFEQFEIKEGKQNFCIFFKIHEIFKMTAI